ncbi:hypothetical protein PC110_g18925 [Phytophthora cactorum]|uniref:Uncharacterized protein n=1 Tax=Phytophthora cactorum TaxID=29920 RepID=A0A329RMV8_9STRA|nr:hypothetical protein PC119_g20640 [Phytophthora cactorum]KAG3142307.1 hypothetical protein C6341_g19491 [Phytophthora cactorum]RAW24652.1 hypothetical protein PC110_g18925 [Phytophthora cactorum]
MVLSLAMAEQLASATGTGYQIGTSLVSKPQQSKLRKANRPRKPLSNPNRVRNELRFELAYLRETVSQLEQELSSLQLDTEENMLCDGRARQEGDAVTKEGNAERENARLRLIVERQGKVAIDLSELLRKRMAECAHASDPYVSERRLCRVIDFHGDIGEFQELFQHLEDAYHEVDDVLQANRLASMDISTHDVHIGEGVGGKYLEFFANKALPFPLQQTSEAAWDHHKGVDKHWGNGRLYEKATKSLDQPYTVLEDFTKEMLYCTQNRDIILFVSKVSPIEIKNKAIVGLTYHLRGYVVTKKSPVSAPGHDLSLLQFCSRISIDKDPGVSYSPNHIRALTRFLVGNTVGNIRCYQERIENALVDQALAKQLIVCF